MPNPYALEQLRRLAMGEDMGYPIPRQTKDISLVEPPEPPPFKYRDVGPPLVSRGGDMAPSIDDGVPAFSGASVLMSAPPGEKVSYDMPTPAPAKTSLFSGGGNLQGNSALQDPYVQRYLGKQALADDLDDQIINQIKARGYAQASPNPAVQREAAAYGGNIDAFQRLLNNTQEDIAASPITKGIGQDEAYRQAESAAFNQGFTGGNAQQEAARYGRDLEKRKVEIPLLEQQEQSRGALERQKVAAQSATDVANIGAQSLAQQYAALQSALAGGNADAIKGVTLPKGGGSVSFQSLTQQRQPPIPPNLMRDITTARTKMAVSGPNKTFLGIPYGQTPEKVMYDQAIANALSAFEQVHPGSKDVADVASWVAGQPDLVGLTSDELVSHPKAQQVFDFSQLTPEEKDQLDQLLYVVRGMPGPAGQADPSAFFGGQ